MPCYETNLISVDLKAADKATLDAALEALGLKVQHNKDGSLTIQTPAGRISVRNGIAECTDACQPWVNKIKQAYSIKTVERIAKRYKFNVTTKPGNKMVLRRY